jgi:hypothetical protein
MMRARVRWSLAALAALALLASACSLPARAERADAVGLVRLANFRIAAPRSIAHGRIRFEIMGVGPSLHELVVTRTPLAAGDLSRNPDGTVNEDDRRVHVIEEAEGVDIGDHRDLDVTLPAGHYVLYCNMEGHYGAGMRRDLTVR